MNFLCIFFFSFSYELIYSLMHDYISCLGVFFFAPTISFKCILLILSLVLTSLCVGVKYTPLNSRLFRLHLCIARLFLKKGRRGSHVPYVTHGRGAGDGQPVPLVDHHHMAIPILQSTPS